MNTKLALAVLWGLSLASPLMGQDAADKDYSAELVRIPPTEPADALTTFVVAPGYKMELVAAEPLVTSPVAASFDEDGRLFVVEMRDYSEQDKEKLGRVRMLTDSDGNGTFDKSTIFAEGLSWPTAIICYGGGVFVGAAPEILFLKDTNRDGQADEQRVVFTGFGRGNVQGLLNSFCWGLDNRIHVAVSTAGAELRYVGGDAKTVGGESLPRPDRRKDSPPTADNRRKDSPPTMLRGRDFAFDPRDPSRFIATSGGGQHGMCFDDFGRKFVCSNSDHIQLIMLEDADLARNPYLAAPSPRVNIAADGPQADVFRISPVEPWREVRTRLRVKGLVPGPIEGGGRAAGYFTSATGITIYRGNAWPKEHRGLAIVGDVGGNLIHRKRLEPNGLELKAVRIDEKSEFVASKDNWFRPVQFLNAPDGGLYVLDMYREVIEHPASLPPVIKKHLDLTSGRDRGRIYRIVPEGFKQPPLPKLSKATSADLVATLGHENGWHRDTAARLLYERQDITAVGALDKLVRSASPPGKVHALHTLAGTNGLTRAVLIDALADEDARVRAHAVRLVPAMVKKTEALAARKELIQACLKRAEDQEPQVRFQFAGAMAELEIENPEPIYARLILQGLDDAWMRLAIQASLKGSPSRLLTSLVRDEQFRNSAGALDYVEPLFVQVAKNTPREFQAMIEDVVQVDADVLLELLKRTPPEVVALLAVARRPSRHERVKEVLDRLEKEATEIASDQQRQPAERLRALTWMAWLPGDQDATLCRDWLDPAQPAELQIGALRHLPNVELRRGSWADEIISRWPKMSPQVRVAAGEALVTDPIARRSVVAAVEKGDINLADLSTELLQKLARSSPTIEVALSKRREERGKILSSYGDSLTLAGDKSRGGELFKKHCAACHKLAGEGHEIGPNLAAMKNRGAEAILTNVLDPNREVNPQYVTYSVITKDGRTYSGIIVAETATSITLQRGEKQQDVILRIDIEELRGSGLSLMPEGLEKELNPQQLADVIEFILKQE